MTLTSMQAGIREDWLCLDFANTLEWHAGPNPEEHLHNFDELVNWAFAKGVLSEAERQHLRAKAGDSPQEAEAAYRRAIGLREAVYRIFSANSHTQRTEAADLAALNEALAAALPNLRLTVTENGFDWELVKDRRAFEALLWPVVLSAAELLTSDILGRVKECADEHGCGWLFVDASRNQSRRWCDMKGCGNRAKARRHYQRSQVGKKMRDGDT